jgi:hypothetical protein
MPIFGKSLFETVLDGIEVEEVEEEDAPILRGPRVAAHFIADTATFERPESRALGALYDDFSEPLVGLPEDGAPDVLDVPEPPTWLDRLSDREVNDDLGLSDGMSPAEIRERRRAFARNNHPDRVHEDFRSAATVRMTIANRLAETALRRG